MRARWLVPVLALTLTGCGADPQSALRADVEAVTDAANAGSAAGVRDAVEELLSTIRAQVASRDLDRAEGERLRTIALRIEQEAALLEPTAPSPSPVEQDTEEPAPEPEPSPEEEEPEPSPSPVEEEPEPSPQVEEPDPAPSEVELPPVEESPPSAQSQSAPSAEPSPAA